MPLSVNSWAASFGSLVVIIAIVSWTAYNIAQNIEPTMLSQNDQPSVNVDSSGDSTKLTNQTASQESKLTTTTPTSQEQKPTTIKSIVSITEHGRNVPNSKQKSAHTIINPLMNLRATTKKTSESVSELTTQPFPTIPASLKFSPPT